jgi:ESCRT-II complex subunit VPS36
VLKTSRPVSNLKSPPHQSGSIHATSHRLFFVSASAQAFPSARGLDDGDKDRTSFALDLALITGSDYYAGLFASSPKVTLHLTRQAVPTDAHEGSSSTPSGGGGDGLFEAWECEVCGNRNPPGLSPQAARICALCGVPRASVLTRTPALGIPTAIPTHVHPSTGLSSSLPSSSGLGSPTAAGTPAPDGLSCPVCTFLNHRSLRECELCGTALPRPPPKSRPAASAPASRPDSPDDGQEKTGMIRLSFRKGGDKKFYEVLKRALQAKAWEVKFARPHKQDGAQGIGIRTYPYSYR